MSSDEDAKVEVSGILANLCIICKAFLDFPREFTATTCVFFHSQKCLDLDRDVPVIEVMIEFLARTQLEFVFPLATIVLFLITQLFISLGPGLAFWIQNPVPGITKYVYLTSFVHFLSSFLASITMLTHLENAQQTEIWTEYLTVSGLCLFWLFQLFNMTVFTRLTSMNFIRARENFNRRIGVEA
ncbi:Protein CBG05107 [Caenorhabditis briggsae]|uniref:Protein CBG05107 n=1 Tax=Caenorhabditis briggsae TaxID=6238 RepID=A8WZ87_CAEBR|nr:Protein CBG05107 [Caenorhabditis briggsae]CAP25697.2 Protein CBG05107 [Caenorhabditis briggsae]